MEGVRSSRRVPGMLAPAGVLRQFDGSRIERQVLAQAFELVWRVEREGMNGIPSMTPGEERLAAKRVTQVAAPRVSSQRHVDAAGGAAGGP